jgi:hypothetical protein
MRDRSGGSYKTRFRVGQQVSGGLLSNGSEPRRSCPCQQETSTADHLATSTAQSGRARSLSFGTNAGNLRPGVCSRNSIRPISRRCRSAGSRRRLDSLLIDSLSTCADDPKLAVAGEHDHDSRKRTRKKTPISRHNVRDTLGPLTSQPARGGAARRRS